MNAAIATTLLAVCASLVGCAAQRVAPLDLHDSRLPIEARRWIADAQDTLAIARARVSDARLRSIEAQSARDDGSSMPPAVATEWHALVAARVSAAAQDLKLEALELELAEHRLELAYARTAMRHDLEVYELAPLEARTEAAQRAVLGAREARQRGRIDLEKRASAWWTAWHAHAQGGGDTAAYWRGNAGR